MYSVSDETRKPIFEGVQGENESREIQFDITPWIEELGEGVCTATVKRPTDTTPYPVTVTRSGNVVTWKPNSTDTSIEGNGAFQLSFSIDNVVAKTRIWNTKIAPSLVGAGDPPDPYDDWLAELQQVAADALQDAQNSEAWAVGQRGGVDVPSTDETYQNNAKYYAELNAGDHAELVDIRIGADGTTYPNAGDAVRGQVANLGTDLISLENGIIHIPVADFSRGGLRSDGTINTGQTYYASTNKDITFDHPVKISVKDGYRYMVFNKNGESSYTPTSYLTYDYFLPANCTFKLQIARVTETWGAADLALFSRQVDIISKDRAEILFNRAQIEQLKDGNELLNAVFTRGSLVNGAIAAYVFYRIATQDVVRYDRDITIIADSGFRFGIHTFNENDEFVDDLGWKTSYTIEANQGFKIVVARTTEDNTEKADVFEFYTKIHAESPFKDYVKEIISEPLLSAPILHNGKPKLIAHMGYRANAPENTTASFINAGKAGYWGIESDVQQTSDGYYVMMHDTTVDRTTNGTGNINEMTLAQIRALQIKDHPDLKVPTFEEYLSICKWYGCVPNIEIKSTVTNSKASFEKLIGIVKSFGFDDKGVIFSGSKWAFDNFRQATETIPYMAIYQNGLSYVWATEFAFCSQYKNAGMCWDLLNGLTFENCEDAHEKDMLICAFITDSTTDVMTSFSVGADFCTTNTVLPTD